ncbi:uncharacterized protein LOC126751553 [Bactrocera neohumeralis]|uniref:uncharacterized protein LOC126751553 n=1 Tax=Bactrocera neohumeralis TaxID=98809 RepID=UPI00216636DD|nr:uncharacterized protein LOC126751553 [Bactrocera neohumeralis]
MMVGVIEIAQVNLHHAAAASAVIASRFTAEKLGALLIQEPWVYKGEAKGLKTEANKVIWDLSSERPRTCIVVRSNIDFFCISEFLTQDLVAVQARDTEGKDFVLASAYFPGETATAPPEAVERLVEHCKRHKLPLVIGCDANAHHTEWGSTDCNARAIVLYRLDSNGEGATLSKIAGLFGVSDGGIIQNLTDRIFKALLKHKDQYLFWPNSDERKKLVSETWGKLPNCVGYVDGTEIPLAEKPSQDPEAYFSRKHQYSVKVQAVCDHSLQIRHLVLGYPGSVHDARIFSNCELSNDADVFFGGA